MAWIEVLFTAFALSMDAVAASLCKGASQRNIILKNALIVGLYFGVFQALMPLIGYLMGSRFETLVRAYDHWVAFVLLSLIGANMIRESFGAHASCDDPREGSIHLFVMLPLAIATSIDALATGVTFAFLGIDILPAVLLIGGVTFLLSTTGVMAGHRLGQRFQSGAERIGGAVLILIGLKILIEHLNA